MHLGRVGSDRPMRVPTERQQPWTGGRMADLVEAAVGGAVDPGRIKQLVRARLLGTGADGLQRQSAPERRMTVQGAVMEVLREQRAILPAGSLAQVMNEVSDEVVGLGPIERLLKDPEVSEVMVNGADDVYVERKGRVERVEGLWFEGEAQVLHLC